MGNLCIYCYHSFFVLTIPDVNVLLFYFLLLILRLILEELAAYSESDFDSEPEKAVPAPE